MMSITSEWFAERDGYDWFVKAEGAVNGENVVAYCGADGDEAYAKRIVADHNACLGIVDPETTVPKLVKAAAILADEYKELEPGHCPNLENLRTVLVNTGQKHA